jgi:sRNA-binding regulator protein Hfq
MNDVTLRQAYEQERTKQQAPQLAKPKPPAPGQPAQPPDGKRAPAQKQEQHVTDSAWLNRWQHSGSLVEITLVFGDHLVGRIVGVHRYSLDVETQPGIVVVLFKHACATVGVKAKES